MSLTEKRHGGGAAVAPASPSAAALENEPDVIWRNGRPYSRRTTAQVTIPARKKYGDKVVDALLLIPVLTLDRLGSLCEKTDDLNGYSSERLLLPEEIEAYIARGPFDETERRLLVASGFVFPESYRREWPAQLFRLHGIDEPRMYRRLTLGEINRVLGGAPVDDALMPIGGDLDVQAAQKAHRAALDRIKKVRAAVDASGAKIAELRDKLQSAKSAAAESEVQARLGTKPTTKATDQTPNLQAQLEAETDVHRGLTRHLAAAVGEEERARAVLLADAHNRGVDTARKLRDQAGQLEKKLKLLQADVAGAEAKLPGLRSGADYVNAECVRRFRLIVARLDATGREAFPVLDSIMNDDLCPLNRMQVGELVETWRKGIIAQTDADGSKLFTPRRVFVDSVAFIVDSQSGEIVNSGVCCTSERGVGADVQDVSGWALQLICDHERAAGLTPDETEIRRYIELKVNPPAGLGRLAS